MMYSGEDIISDVNLILNDRYDVFDPWTDALIESSDPSSIWLTKLLKGETEEIEGIIHNRELLPRYLNLHLECLRFADFAVAAINSEMSFIEKNQVNSSNVAQNHVYSENHKRDMEFKVLAQNLPIEVITSDVPVSSKVVESKRDSSTKQLKRDIERDKIVINGMSIIGADGGIDNIIVKIGNTIDNMLSQCNLPVLSTTSREDLSYKLLSTVCRTNSGGITFQILQSMLNSESILIPLSNMAKPLRIRISLDKIPDNHSHSIVRWGICCHLTAQTSFRVASRSDENINIESNIQNNNAELDGIQATYNCVLVFNVDPRANETIIHFVPSKSDETLSSDEDKYSYYEKESVIFDKLKL